MIKHNLGYLILISLAILLVGCSFSQQPEFHFEGDGQSLVIQDNEVPAGWYRNEEFSERSHSRNMENWGVVYTSSPDQYGTQSVIRHDVFITQIRETPYRSIETLYEYYVDVSSPLAELPQEYDYKSPIADEFKVIYSPEKSFDQTIVVGYTYYVMARYGNVVSEFVAIVEDEERTGIKAGDANVLPWSEVERLLKLIDEKFEKAGFPQKRG